MEEWKDQLEINGAEIPNDGILTARYSGGGDDGALDGSFEEINQQLPADMEDMCYDELSSNFSGWSAKENREKMKRIEMPKTWGIKSWACRKRLKKKEDLGMKLKLTRFIIREEANQNLI